MTVVEIIIVSLTAVLIFVIGATVGLYINHRSSSAGRHRQATPTALPLRFDDRKHLSQEGLDDFQRDLKETMDRPHNAQRIDLLRDYVDSNSATDQMEEGHWEGMSGDLKPKSEPQSLRPEETSSSLLGLSGGAIKPTGSVKPVFGETEHLTYDPEDYEGPLICQSCKRSLVKGETFWAVSLPEEGDGVFIPICDKCEAKSHD
jgi:hypothetical protein